MEVDFGNVPQVSIEQYKTIVKILWESENGRDNVPYVQGATGIGKSEANLQLAKNMDLAVVDFRLAYRNAVDLMGIPVPRDNKTHWLVPAELPDEKVHGKRGVLFLEEMSCAPTSVLNASLQLLLEKRIGEYKLAPGWFICGAGNRLNDNAFVNKIPGPVAARMKFFELVSDTKGWLEWAGNNNIHRYVTAYIRMFPDKLHQYDPDKENETKHPNPRAWKFVSNTLYAFEEAKMALERKGKFTRECAATIASDIGNGERVTFEGFVKLEEQMPDAKKILNGTEWIIPKENGHIRRDILFMLIGAIAHQAEEKHLKNILYYAQNCLEIDFSVCLMKDVANKNNKALKPALLKLPGAVEWMETRKSAFGAYDSEE